MERRLTFLWALLLSEIYGVRCAATDGTTVVPIATVDWADNITVTNYTEDTVTVSREHPGEVELCWQELPPGDTAPTCEHPPPDQTSHVLRLDACRNHRITMTSPVGRTASVEFSAARDGQDPGRPRGFKGLRYPGGVVLFEWVPPPPPGSYCIQHYVLRVVGGDAIADHIPASSTSHEAHSLPVCGSVNVSLTTVNAVGRYSFPAHFKLPTQEGAPGAVEDLKVGRSRSHGFHLIWRRPERADCLREYAVCWRPTTQTNETCATEKPSGKDLLWYEVTRLHHCTEYHLRVISVGAGQLQGISPTLTHSTGPDPVTNLRLDRLEEHQATVSWSAPACAVLYTVCWGMWSGRGSHFCLNTTSTSATITALHQGNNYTIIVAAISPEGGISDTRIITLQKPNPVEDLKLLNDSPSSINVTWRFTGHPGPVVDHLELCWTPLNGNSSEEGCVQLPPTATTHVIHELSPCKWYRVNVSTVHMDSAKSNQSSAELFTMDDGTTPAGELEDFTSALTKTGMLASWKLLEEGCVSHVRVCWGAANGTKQSCLTAPSHQSEVAISEVRPCTNYSVTGTALARNGTELDAQTTYRLSGAGKPRNVSAMLVAPGTAHITWLPPPPGEDCVVKYELDGDELPANATEYTVTEVSPCSYSWHEMLVISAEDTRFILVYYASGLSAPGAVRDMNALVIRSHSIHVGWMPPEENSECLKKYSVCWKEVNATTEQCDSMTYTTYPRYTILGLKPCTEYTISVAAVGGNATSNYTTIRKYTGPVAVEDVEAQQVDSQTVSLKWSQERCASLYSVCWGAWDGAGSHSCINVSNSKAKVFGLRNLHSGSNYTVILTAIGRAGSISDSTIVIVQNSCPVSNLTVTDHTREAASVSWDLAPNCRQRLSHFEVCWEVVPYDLQDCTHAGADASSFHLQQLRPCRWYNVTVTAVYVDGVASQATSVMQFTDVPATKDPSPLASLEATVNHRKGGIVLEWELNDEMDSCSEYVTACWTSSRDPDKGWCERRPSYKPRLVIDDAKFCSTYIFNAYVETVDKRQSKELNTSVVLGPGPPRNVMARSPSTGTLLVMWDPPLPGDDCVSYYTISRGLWGFAGPENISANATEYLLTDLPPCSFSFHTVLAFSEDGQQSPDKMVYASAGMGAPGEIRNLSVISVQSHSVHLQWSTPEMYYSCLKKYSVCWGKTSEANETCSVQRVVEYPQHSILGLKSCTRYYVNVSSQGEEIHGNSSQLQVTTGPEPVGEVKMVVSNGLMTFEWADVPCATSYSVCWGEWNDEGKHSCLTTSAPATAIGDMAGFQPEGRYTIMVHAIGEDGGASSPYVLYLVRPEPVENLHVTSTSSDSISIAWAPLSSPEEVHQQWLCLESLKTLYKNCSILSPYLTSFTLGNVASCSWYNVSIALFGHNNMQSPVAYVLQFIKGPETNGTAGVVELTTTSHGNSLSMSWKLSNSFCNAATRVCWTPADKEGVNETCNDIPSYQTNTTIPDLEFCSEYSVSVEVGQELHPQTAVGSTAPEAVMGLAVVGQITSERELTVSWQPSACARLYQVCWDQQEWDDDAHHSCQNTSDTNHTFTDLHWGTNYTVAVAALRINSSSDNRIIVVQLDADRGLDLTLQAVNPDNVTVTWKYSQGEGQPIHQLVFCLTLEASGLEKCKLANTSDYEVTLAALQPCSGYLLRAKALAVDDKVLDAASLKFFTNQEGDQDSEVEGTIEGFTVLDITSRTLTFKWDGLVPKRCIKNYELMATAVIFGDVFSMVLPNNTYSYTPENVPPCQLMQVFIVAILPDGSYAGTAMIKTDTGLQAPGEVEDVVAFLTSSSSIHITWKPPSYNMECLVRNRICWGLEESPPEAGNCSELTQTEFNAYSIEELQPCTNYSISVAGVGGENVTGNATYITLSTGPEPVRGLTAVRREPGEVTLGWGASACAQAYSVCWGAWTGRGTHNCGTTTLTSYNITGLENTTAYSFIVKAVGEDGQLSDKAVITFNETPGKVQDIKIFHTSSTSIHLQWEPPQEKTKCLLKYAVCWKERALKMEKCSKVAHQPYNAFSITGLRPCTNYSISVAAVCSDKDVGNITVIDWSTGPEPVRGLTAVRRESGEVTLGWEAPACARAYSVCWGRWTGRGAHSCGNTSHTSYNVTGLESATAYSFIVEAEIPKSKFSANSVITWNGTIPTSILGHVVEAVNRTVERTVDVASGMLDSLGL